MWILFVVGMAGCELGGACSVTSVARSTPTEGESSCTVRLDDCPETPSVREVTCSDAGCSCTPGAAGGTEPSLDGASFCLVADEGLNGDDVDAELVELAVEGCGWSELAE